MSNYLFLTNKYNNFPNSPMWWTKKEKLSPILYMGKSRSQVIDLLKLAIKLRTQDNRFLISQQTLEELMWFTQKEFGYSHKAEK